MSMNIIDSCMQILHSVLVGHEIYQSSFSMYNNYHNYKWLNSIYKNSKTNACNVFISSNKILSYDGLYAATSHTSLWRPMILNGES